MSARRFRVRGRVQGVGFRYFVRRAARDLGLEGGVRNDADGAVTAVAAGSDDALERFAAALADGPPAARVSGVDAAPLDRLPDDERFDVRF
jgi:acylphosphatase